MTMPVRRSPGGVIRERPLGWARNPLMEFDQLLNEMSGLLESTVGGTAPARAWTPMADVTESDDAFHVEIELPGVKSEDVDVEASSQELVVSGEIKEKERKGVLRRSTRRSGAFEYRWRLPVEADTEKITAQMTDGVLTITVPKAEVARPRHIEISETSESTESST
ncbi:Hsp20/alpha crystallin family protein [Streptomyces thermocarboxydovorans]|uniref:Hsp20/alpha crystallin family protein n=1 Tax=Streptomyces thermocarboxydovorans TaxID=59298 RepID=A0ABN1HF90_9ACTN